MYFISEIYLFMGYQYFYYVYNLKLFGPRPKVILIRVWLLFVLTNRIEL